MEKAKDAVINGGELGQDDAIFDVHPLNSHPHPRPCASDLLAKAIVHGDSSAAQFYSQTTLAKLATLAVTMQAVQSHLACSIYLHRSSRSRELAR